MVSTVALGGTASNIKIAPIGHGLMMMTWVPNPVPDEQAFEAIKQGVDAAGGAKVLLNSGEFYGQNWSAANLELLARFYKKYPEYIDRTILCVKGGIALGGKVDSSLENLRRSIDNINAKLENTKRVDIFESARVDSSLSIEEAIKNFKVLIDEGKFDHIGLSECNAETLKRANAVHPIASVEIEVSPWSYEEETKKGIVDFTYPYFGLTNPKLAVIAVAGKLNITVLAYSPLGRGFLTGQITKAEDIPEGDFRKHLDRFQPENFSHNLQLVDALKALAARRGVTPGQLALAWVRSLGNHVVPIPGSSKSTRTLENLAASEIILTKEEQGDIDTVLEKFSVKGTRYTSDTAHLWG